MYEIEQFKTEGWKVFRFDFQPMGQFKLKVERCFCFDFQPMGGI